MTQEIDKRWVVINASNIVVNVVVWDGETGWSPPEGCIVVNSDHGQLGDVYDAGQFTRPEPVVDERRERYTELRNKLRDNLSTSDELMEYLRLRDGIKPEEEGTGGEDGEG